MGKVTEITGTSLGLANFHFESKDRLFDAVLQHLAAQQRARWQSRDQGPALSSRALLMAIVESRFPASICAHKKLAVWFAFYGDASARATCRRAVGNIDDERLEATVAVFSEMIAEAGYTLLDPVEAVLTVEAMHDGLWLNMLLHPVGYRRTICRTRALNVIAALFPKHFDSPQALG